MNSVERYLTEYWYAKKSIGRLMIDLSLANHVYEQSYSYVHISGNYERIRTKEKKNLSSVELAAVIILDERKAEIRSIEKRLTEERKRITDIENTVEKARLCARETDYVRLRYFEKNSAETVAQRLFCSAATCGRIRQSAVKKIEQIMTGEQEKEAG